MKGVRTHSRVKLLESGNDVSVEVNITTIQLPIMTTMQIIINSFLSAKHYPHVCSKYN